MSTVANNEAVTLYSVAAASSTSSVFAFLPRPFLAGVFLTGAGAGLASSSSTSSSFLTGSAASSTSSSGLRFLLAVVETAGSGAAEGKS